MASRPRSAAARAGAAQALLRAPAAGPDAKEGSERVPAWSLKRPQSQGSLRRRADYSADDVKHGGQSQENAPKGNQLSCSPGKVSLQMLEKSASAPSLRRAERKSNVQMSPSHYGYFANSVPAISLGSASEYKYKSLLAIKQRRDLGQKAMLPLGHHKTGSAKNGAWMADSGSSPAMRRSVSSIDDLVDASPMGRASITGRRASQRLSVSLPQNELVDLHTQIARARKLDLLKQTICEGMRVLVLCKPAPPLVGLRRGGKPIAPAHHRYQATREEVQQVYKVYSRLILNDSSNDDQSSDSELSARPRPGLGRTDSGGHVAAHPRDQHRGDAFSQMEALERVIDSRCQEGAALPPVAWPAFLSWVEDEVDLARDAKHKSAIGGLFRAMKALRQLYLDPRSSGVTLIMLLQWTWPSARRADISEMLTWICLHELQEVSFPMPEVISSQERRCLVQIFNSLDNQGRGYCYAEDIAGGPNPDTLKNIVDADTVKAVCGGGKIYLDQFLEIMCEDNFRGHDNAERAVLEDGRTLIHHVCDVVGFSGWMLEDTFAVEETRWRTINALRAEVLKFRDAAGQGKAFRIGAAAVEDATATGV